MSPICMLPALMLFAPNHSIMTVTPYMMSVMTGPMNAMVRLTNSCVSRSAALAAPKRSSSCRSRWNARMTGRPVSTSRLTRLTSSTRCCMVRNCGMAIFMSIADKQQHRRDGQRDDPAEAGLRARDHDDAAEADDRRIEHDAHDQHAHRLDLRDVVRAARDERGRRELVHLGGRERQHLCGTPARAGRARWRRTSARRQSCKSTAAAIMPSVSRSIFPPVRSR